MHDLPKGPGLACPPGSSIIADDSSVLWAKWRNGPLAGPFEPSGSRLRHLASKLDEQTGLIRVAQSVY